MKNIYKIISSSIVLAGLSMTSTAQVTGGATASATIVIPMSIVNGVDMNFGNISVSSSNGTVVLPASGATARTSTGGVSLPMASGIVTAAKFTVSGTANYTYAITLPSDAVTLGSGSNTMDATSFTSSLGATGALSAEGTQVFYVGATLSLANTQGMGSYVSTAPFNVTVNYN